LIVVECYSDEYLIKQIGSCGRRIWHEEGKGNVISRCSKQSDVIGLIDADPTSPQPGLKELYLLTEKFGKLTFYRKREDSPNILIQITPRLEDWLIERARVNNMPIRDYDLPESPRQLHRIKHVEKDSRFHRFISHLIGRDAEIQKIKDVIMEASR
jgi:hypothetical protein